MQRPSPNCSDGNEAAMKMGVAHPIAASVQSASSEVEARVHILYLVYRVQHGAVARWRGA